MAKTSKKTTKEKVKSVASGSILEEQNLMHAASYFPYLIGAIFVFFLWKSDKKKALHHVKYSAILAIGAIILVILLKGFFASVVNFAYIGISIFLAFKAYKWEKVTVEILDTIEEKISEKVGK